MQTWINCLQHSSNVPCKSENLLLPVERELVGLMQFWRWNLIAAVCIYIKQGTNGNEKVYK